MPRKPASQVQNTSSPPSLALPQPAHAGWSSPVARQAHNLKVRGSNPLPATTFVDSLKSAPILGSDSHLMILHGGLVLFLRGISTMASNLRLSSLIPAGLIVESTAEEEGVIVVSARAGATWGGLPAVWT